MNELFCVNFKLRYCLIPVNQPQNAPFCCTKRPIANQSPNSFATDAKFSGKLFDRHQHNHGAFRAEDSDKETAQGTFQSRPIFTP